jgi:hypothetical protein
MPDNRGGRIKPFKAGATALSARHLNSIVSTVNQLATRITAPTQPRAYGKGASVIILTLVEQFGDYLECTDANLNTVYVAKPYEIRQTPFDGMTIGGVTYTYTSASERVATGGFDEETQFITPSYVVDAEIFAVKVRGETGVETAEPAPILYIELNQGRAWAYDPDA